MKEYIMYAAGLILILALMYGGYHLNRWFNYTFGYQAQVVEEVCRMVQPEYLINPQECK